MAVFGKSVGRCSGSRNAGRARREIKGTENIAVTETGAIFQRLRTSKGSPAILFDILRAYLNREGVLRLGASVSGGKALVELGTAALW